MEVSNVEVDSTGRKEVYFNLFKGILTNAFSVFLVLITCKLVAVGVHAIHKKESVFDSALKVLLHYSEGAIGILFLTSSSVILLVITLLLDPIGLAIAFRKYVAIPALNISGHMLSMVAGATAGSFLLISIKYCSLEFDLFWKVLFIILFCILFSFGCNSAKLFFEHEFVNLKKENNKIITGFTILFGCVSTFVMYIAYVYNFTPALAH